MNKLLIILTIVFLYSCNSNLNKNQSTDIKTIRDTIKIIKKVIDTVYIEKKEEDDFSKSEFFIYERLPDWLLKSNLFNGIKLKNEYQLDNRLNPLYLEADYNGDGNIDIAIPIKEIKTKKAGFVIIHGTSNKFYIIGAGVKVKNGLSDDMDYINIWKVNRKKINEAGLEENTGTGAKGELIINNPSLQIEKSELGGGQIYWNGNEYAYFHQTC